MMSGGHARLTPFEGLVLIAAASTALLITLLVTQVIL